ncbi:hypothetical protein CPC735_035950 [Coccidioides posadasii C735 delta SOWgp]|uniref:Aminotransferase class I/classII large domain-containing protein n=1 Tax=Coccidioides posadasii (strain C735) TaxID=222929 RepID=C5P1Y6_COCP7|nr:hypothetical protein CPC735_035950 [Coccidioides posadasii C735 delta SOWgp]EER28889.1 hypothetical protein CPC735_035950 [Coccidioides posadasii C735 delta SOWgp]|eukprot:XP_003071034.1 hypothetical protein CPC735_035950 [Coccidioides posadasii C735 delta SOWgp]
MVRSRPTRLAHIAPIGVDRMGDIADLSGKDFLRLENLDVDIPPDPEAIACTKSSADQDQNNSYLPFIGQRHLREIAARHVSSISGVQYSGEENCIISSGGLSGILNVLLATVEVGDEVIVTDPTYAGLINRVRLADWDLISKLCVEADLLLILDTAMERLLFDKRPLIHPAGLPGMANRTIIVGAASKELRMIGWRAGWIVAPKEYIPDLIAVSLANVVVPVGIA